MKKCTVLLLALFVTLSAGAFGAEEEGQSPASPSSTTAPTTEPTRLATVGADVAAVVPTTPDASAAALLQETTPPAPTAAPAAGPTAPTEETQDLEFVSGEVTAADDTAKTLTVKIYGENEDAASDKSLAVTVDSSTDITDGEKDRELKSLAAGTEVDVEYDPATKKATYIFVY